jgi:hypothetical protein
MPDQLKEGNILKLILILRFTCATFDVGHPILRDKSECVKMMEAQFKELFKP